MKQTSTKREHPQTNRQASQQTTGSSQHAWDYYNAIAEGYDALYGEEQESKLRFILKHVALTPNDTLLDVGCGTGASFDLLPCRCRGVEPSTALMNRSIHREAIIQGVAEQLPFPDHAFDYVLALTMIHHATNLHDALQEMARVCKKMIIITVLKKSPKRNAIDTALRSELVVERVLDQGVDLVYFCRPRRQTRAAL
ncbi:SAM-dependent methyltransferase [Candidatus Woesearchaeota archaeon]|nr:MAG: SAM-dependent methyltransferase [Candidatus Woesearchaeota archaeon]